MSNSTNGPCNRSVIITAESRKRSRYALSVALLLWLAPFTVYSACWEIELRNTNITATDLWQIKNSVNDDAVILGKSGEESQAIAVARIQSITVTNSIASKWSVGSNAAVGLDIQLVDGNIISLISEMGLYYVADDKRHEVPLAKVTAVTRCSGSEEIPPILPLSAPIEAAKAAAIVVMENGDLLYGDVTNDQLRWQTSYANIGFKPVDLKSIRPDQSGASAGVLETLAGDMLKGNFVDSSISIHLTTGQFIEIPTSQIATLDFVGMEGTNRAPTEAME